MALALTALAVYRLLLSAGPALAQSDRAQCRLGSNGLGQTAACRRAATLRQLVRRFFLPFLLYLSVPILAVVLFSFAGRWAGRSCRSEFTLRYWTDAFSDHPASCARSSPRSRWASLTTIIVLILAVPAIYWARVKNHRITPDPRPFGGHPLRPAVPGDRLRAAAVQRHRRALAPGHVIRCSSSPYVAISFPFVYWALDASMAASTFEPAGRGGERPVASSTWQTIVRIVLPSIEARTGHGSHAVLRDRHRRVRAGQGPRSLDHHALAVEREPDGGCSGRPAYGSLAVVTTIVFVLLFGLSAAVADVNRGQLGQQGTMPGTMEQDGPARHE